VFVIVFSLVLVKVSSSLNIDSVYVYTKLASLTQTQGGPTDMSIAMRSEFLRTALHMFLDSVLIGKGLGAFTAMHHFVTHDDYAFLLCDMGLVGLILFMSSAIYSLRMLVRRSLPIYLLLPFYIYLLFINAYTFPIYVIYLGILMNYSDETKKSRSWQMLHRGKL
jgi:O-antigen ligase